MARLAQAFVSTSIVISLLGFTTVTSAAVVTQCGPNICYEYDNAQVGVGLFGLPSLSGDALVFLSPMFRAESLDGAGLDTASATFDIDRVYTQSGENVSVVYVYESGDYDVNVGDTVSAELILDVANNNSAETYNNSWLFSATGDSGGQQEWNLDGVYNPDAMFSAQANDVAVSITDVLKADTDAIGESAWIQKKLTLSVAAVPVPAAVWLFGSAIAFLGGAYRRRT